jgi:hypothetical protein
MPSAAFKKPAYYHYAEGFERFPCRSMKTLAAVMTRATWSPCEFRGDYRKEENFIRATHIGIDIDGDYALEEAMGNFCDVPHVIGTTRNHNRDKNGVVAERFRIVFKLERPATLEEFRSTCSWWVDKLGVADPACVDGARLFYPCSEIVSWSDEGDPEQVREPKKVDHSVQFEKFQHQTWNGLKSKSWLILENQVIAEGGRNSAFFAGIKDMVKCGLTEAQVWDFLHRVCPTQKSKSALDPEELGRLVGNAFASAIKELSQHASRVK